MQQENDFRFRNGRLLKRSFCLFANFKDQKQFCDVTFTIGTRRIYAHRIIVAAAIPFFRDMFTSEKKEISMPDIDPSVFEYLIDFAYNCELKITKQNVRDLLFATCHFRMYEARDACRDFLAERLSPGNALNFRKLAVKLHFPDLISITDHYIKERFAEICQTREFFSCSFLYIKELIGKEDLQVDSEEKVLEAVLRWVSASPDERNVHLPDLLRQVRLSLMTPLYLTDVVVREELIRTSLENRNLIDEARNYNLFPQRRKDAYSFSTEPRQFLKTSTARLEGISMGHIYTVFCQETYNVHLLNFPHNSKWLECYSQSYDINCGSTAQLNNKIYFFHGSSAWEYDPTEKKSKNLADLQVSRLFSGAASLKNKIYVCGGRTGIGRVLTFVECYDPDTEEWTKVRSMNTARTGLCVVTLGEYIYALGGRNDACVHNSVERYPSVTGKWQTMAPMLSKRNIAGAAALNGRIYVCGGKTDLNQESTASAEMYDPMKNRWKFISPMNTARCEFTLVSSCGKLYALGGENSDGKYLCSSEVYDPVTDTWTPGPQMNSKHRVSGAVVV